MARKPKNLINDVGNWLGGPVRQAIASTPARTVQNIQNVAKNNPIGLAVQNAMSGYSTFRDKGYVEAVKGQAKIIAVDLALLAAGEGAGKAGKAIVKTGVPAKIVNAATRRQVVIHGTGEILGSSATGPYKYRQVAGRIKKPITPGAVLEPRAGSPAAPDVAAVYGWNPKDKNAYYNVPNQVRIYSSQARSFGYAKQADDFIPQNQVVIGTARKKDIYYPQGKTSADRYIQQVRGPVKIKSIVSSTPGGPESEYSDAIMRAARQAGQAMKGKPSKVEQAIKKVKTNRANKRSTF